MVAFFIANMYLKTIQLRTTCIDIAKQILYIRYNKGDGRSTYEYKEAKIYATS